MKQCDKCGGEMVAAGSAWPYRECGLEDVDLLGVEAFLCLNCANRAVTIPRLGELHALLARTVAAKSGRLSPAERQYLRSYIGWSRGDFAEEMRYWFGDQVQTDEAGEFDERAERMVKRLVLTDWRLQGYPAEPPEAPRHPVALYVAEAARWDLLVAA